jgi:hypothetical protein
MPRRRSLEVYCRLEVGQFSRAGKRKKNGRFAVNGNAFSGADDWAGRLRLARRSASPPREGLPPSCRVPARSVDASQALGEGIFTVMATDNRRWREESSLAHDPCSRQGAIVKWAESNRGKPGRLHHPWGDGRRE